MTRALRSEDLDTLGKALKRRAYGKGKRWNLEMLIEEARRNPKIKMSLRIGGRLVPVLYEGPEVSAPTPQKEPPMAHEVESMFSVLKTPWHGLGTIVNEAPNSAEAMRLAGLDWNVELVKLFAANGIEVPEMRGAQRSTDGRVLGIMTDAYKPLQNSEAFSFFDPFVEAGEASYETAGSLREGERVWVLAKLQRDPSVIVKGDEVEKFVLLSNGHDGIMSVRVGFTPIRVVCANTLRLAHDASASNLIRVRHTARVSDNVTALREIMDMANASFEASADQYRALAKKEINAADLKSYVHRVFNPEADDDGAESSGGRVLAKVTELFEGGRGSAQKTNQRALDVAYQYVSVAA